MKIKYLSADDRRNFRVLRQISDKQELRELLSRIFQQSRSMQAMWEYRKWLHLLAEEELEGYPELICPLSIIYALEGEVSKAEKLANQLSDDTIYGTVSKLLMPGYDKLKYFRLIHISNKKGWCPIFNMPLTVGRPSLLNGVWDFTPYGDLFQSDRKKIEAAIGVVFGGQAEYIYEVAYAEYLYWQDDCYNALVKLVGIIPFLREKQDMRLLFVALTLQSYIMVLSGQAASAVPMMEILKQQMLLNDTGEFMGNVDALEAWAAMYDGDYQKVAKWMREEAPDEYGKFCMLDLFRYFVKMRAYLIQGKYLAITALASRIMPLLEAGERYMDCCELHIIWAMSDDAAGREKEALEHIEKALILGERYHYDRLFADEGKRVHKILMRYKNVCGKQGENVYIDRVLKMTEKVTMLYPRYLKSQLPKMPELTEAELRILWFLADCRTNGEIAEITGTTVDNIKKHCKNINAKLEVKNRHQAVQRAIEIGILNVGTIKK